MPYKDPGVRRQKLHEAYLRRKAAGYKHPVEYERRRRADLRIFLEELKDVPCADCSGRFPPECMDFDHVIGDKRYGVGAVAHVSRRVILEEAAKCDIICANCHRIRTRQRGESKRGGEMGIAARNGLYATSAKGYHA